MNKIPLANPAHPPTRLLRSIFGYCPDCDETREHAHRCLVCNCLSTDNVICAGHESWDTTPVCPEGTS